MTMCVDSHYFGGSYSLCYLYFIRMPGRDELASACADLHRLREDRYGGCVCVVISGRSRNSRCSGISSVRDSIVSVAAGIVPQVAVKVGMEGLPV